MASRLKHDARYYLGKLYFDAVAYGSEELGFVSDVIARGHKYEKTAFVVSEIPDRALGSTKMLFGTDHPFFPPPSHTDKEGWKSVLENLKAIDGVHGWTEADKDGVRGRNALSLFKLW
jgi:aminocarboxymuconate-semialdehyde decarboxylase